MSEAILAANIIFTGLLCAASIIANRRPICLQPQSPDPKPEPLTIDPIFSSTTTTTTTTERPPKPYGKTAWHWVEGWAAPEIEVRNNKVMLWQDFDEILPNGDIKTTRCLADPLCGRRVTQLDAPRVRIHPPQYPPWLDCIPRHPSRNDAPAGHTAEVSPSAFWAADHQNKSPVHHPGHQGTSHNSRPSEHPTKPQGETAP